MIAVGSALVVEIGQRRLESRERLVVVERPLYEAESLGQSLPDLLAEPGARMLTDRVVHHRGEILVVPITPGEADESERRWQQTAIGQVVDRGHQLLAREITGHAEDDQTARAGDAR